jgi:hypothetical protein
MWIEPDPAAVPHVRRAEIGLRILFDQRLLQPRLDRQPHGQMPVAVMIVRKHDEDLVPDEKSRLAVGEALLGLREGEAEAADAGEMDAALCGHYYLNLVYKRDTFLFRQPLSF